MILQTSATQSGSTPRYRSAAILVAVATFALLAVLWWVVRSAVEPAMPETIRVEHIRPLGGQALAPPDPPFVRIVAADAALASRAFSADFSWGTRRTLEQNIDRMADAAELLRADVLVVFDLPVSGDRLEEVRPVSAIASHGELWWRAEFDRVDRRFAAWPNGGRAAWLGRGRVSTVVFSRYPLSVVDASRTPAAPAWPWDPAGNWEASLRVDCGPTCVLVVRIDEDARAPLDVASHEVVIARPGSVRAPGTTPVQGDDGALAVLLGAAFAPRQQAVGGFFYESSPRNSVSVDLTMPAP